MNCDTSVCMNDTTAYNRTIFVKNSDRHPNEAQEVTIIPELKIDDSTIIETTYAKVKPLPHVKESQRCLLCKPIWMWGAEMGSNAAGVIIGNEAAFPKLSSNSRVSIYGKIGNMMKSTIGVPFYTMSSFARLLLSLFFGNYLSFDNENDYYDYSYTNRYSGMYNSLYDDLNDNNNDNSENENEILLDKGYLTGMDLVRLGLMFGTSAESAVKIIANYLDCANQGGIMQWKNQGSSAAKEYSSCFMIVDRNETWILESFGQWYVGKKFENGIHSISNVYSLEGPFDIVSNSLRIYLQRKVGFFYLKTLLRDLNTESYFGSKLPYYFSHGYQRSCVSHSLLYYFAKFNNNRKNNGNNNGQKQLNIDIYDIINVTRSHYARNIWKTDQDNVSVWHFKQLFESLCNNSNNENNIDSVTSENSLGNEKNEIKEENEIDTSFDSAIKEKSRDTNSDMSDNKEECETLENDTQKQGEKSGVLRKDKIDKMEMNEIIDKVNKSDSLCRNLDYPIDYGMFGCDICMHSGFGPCRGSQTTNSLIVVIEPNGELINFVTGTACACISTFKPIFIQNEIPSKYKCNHLHYRNGNDINSMHSNSDKEYSFDSNFSKLVEIGSSSNWRYYCENEKEINNQLWWKHETLHRMWNQNLLYDKQFNQFLTNKINCFHVNMFENILNDKKFMDSSYDSSLGTNIDYQQKMMDNYWQEADEMLNEFLVQARKCVKSADLNNKPKKRFYKFWQWIWNVNWGYWNNMAGMKMNNDGSIESMTTIERNKYQTPLVSYKFYNNFLFKKFAILFWTILLAFVAMASGLGFKHL